MQRGTVTMELPGGIAGAVTAASATVIGGALWLRKWLSRDAVDRAGDSAAVSMIKLLRTQLNQEREYVKEILAALNLAHEQMDGMRKEMARMTNRIESLERQVRSLGGSP